MASGYDERLFKDLAFLRSAVQQCVLLKDVDSLLELEAVLDGRRSSIVWAGLSALGIRLQGPTNAAWAPGAAVKPIRRGRGRPCGPMSAEKKADMLAKRAATLAARRASV
jgi:hypothetical protein